MIDFFKPVEAAWSRMENGLFKAFDIGKWFVLGFSAWLASFLDGGGANFNLGNWSDGAEKKGVSHDVMRESVEKVLGWGLPIWLGILGLVFVVLLCFVLVFIWLGSRGQFMFLDNLLHNRAEVKKPWTEFRRQGNSLAVFLSVIAGISLLVVFLFFGGALTYFWQDLLGRKVQNFAVYAPWIVGMVLMIPVWLAATVFIFFLREFGIPIMYRNDCSAGEAAKRVWALGCSRPLDYLVYFFLRCVMGILFIMLSCVAGCLTCCLGFLPYLNAVLTLPLRVFRVSYTLECLSQMNGESYWPSSEPPAAPPLPPSVRGVA